MKSNSYTHLLILAAAVLFVLPLYFSNPRSAEAVLSGGLSQCVGGTLVGTYSDLTDASSIGPTDINSLCEQVTPPGGCCAVEQSQVALFGETVPGGFPTNNMIKVRGYDGGTVQPGGSCQGTKNLQKQCIAIQMPAAPAAGPLIASLVANPTSITSGQQSLLSWGSQGALECQGINFSTGGAPSGSIIVTPATTTTYKVNCNDATRSATAQATVTVTQPPSCSNVCSGQSLVNSCSGAVVEACSSQCSTSCGGGDGDVNPPPPQQCIAGLICVGADLYQQDASCRQNFVQACAFGCSQGACYDDPNQVPSTAPSSYIVAQPAFVRKGAACQLQFSAKNVTSCRISGASLTTTVGALNNLIATTTVSTGPIQSTQSYQFSCTGTDLSVLDKEVRCNILPTFKEI